MVKKCTILSYKLSGVSIITPIKINRGRIGIMLNIFVDNQLKQLILLSNTEIHYLKYYIINNIRELVSTETRLGSRYFNRRLHRLMTGLGRAEPSRTEPNLSQDYKIPRPGNCLTWWPGGWVHACYGVDLGIPVAPDFHHTCTLFLLFTENDHYNNDCNGNDTPHNNPSDTPTVSVKLIREIP